MASSECHRHATTCWFGVHVLTTHVQKKDFIKETALRPSHVVHEPSRDFWSWLKFHGVCILRVSGRRSRVISWLPARSKPFRSHTPEKHSRITPQRNSPAIHPRETLQRYTPEKLSSDTLQRNSPVIISTGLDVASHRSKGTVWSEVPSWRSDLIKCYSLFP